MRNKMGIYLLVAGASLGLPAAYADEATGIEADPAIALEAPVDAVPVDDASGEEPVDTGEVLADEGDYVELDEGEYVDEELGDPWLEEGAGGDEEIVVEDEITVDEETGTDEGIVLDEPVDVKIDDGAQIGTLPGDEDGIIRTFDGGPVLIDDGAVIGGVIEGTESGDPQIYYMGSAPGGVEEGSASGEETLDAVDPVVGEEEVVDEQPLDGEDEIVEEKPIDDDTIVLDDPEVVTADGEVDASGDDNGEVVTTGEDNGETIDNPEIYYTTGGPLESAGGPIRTLTGSEVERDVDAGSDAAAALDIGTPADVLDGNATIDADDAAARATRGKTATR